MEDKLVTVANFAYGPDPVSQAELARLKLEAEGVDCYLTGRNFTGVYWLLSAAGHGVQIQVKESDEKRALEILCEKKQIEGEEFEEDLADDEEDEDVCPKCNSKKIEYEKYSNKLLYLSLLIFRLPITYLKNRYTCQDCGHKWKEK